MGPPKFFDVSLPACHGLRTPADLHILATDGCFVLAWGSLKHSPSATSLSRSCTSTSGSAVSPTAYRILCVRFTCLVRHSFDSATGATLNTGGWLALTRQGLSPCKIRQASLGAITTKLTCRGRCKSLMSRETVMRPRSGAAPSSAAITARTGHRLLFIHISSNRAKQLQQLFRSRSRRGRVLAGHQLAVHLDVGGPVGGFAVDATPFL
jgi:hypothetical protein